jgi:hypothetical protein
MKLTSNRIKSTALSVVAVAAIITLSATTVAAQTSGESEAAGAAFSFLFLAIICCATLFSLAYLALKVYLTIDATSRDYGDNNNDMAIGIISIWVIDSFIPIIGLVIYYFLIMQKYPKKS